MTDDFPNRNEVYNTSVVKRQFLDAERSKKNFEDCKQKIIISAENGEFLTSCILTEETMNYFKRKGYEIREDKWSSLSSDYIVSWRGK